MAKVQKVSTREFKEEAVRHAQTSGEPITQVVRELGISDTSIHQWHKELGQYGKEAFSSSGHQTLLEEENCHLKRELERVQQERDILKKTHIEFLLNGERMKSLLKQPPEPSPEQKHEANDLDMQRIPSNKEHWCVC